jgi:hypothetical protein
MDTFNHFMFYLIGSLVVCAVVTGIGITVITFAMATFRLTNPRWMTLVFGHKRWQSVAWLAEKLRPGISKTRVPARAVAFVYWHKASWRGHLMRDMENCLDRF